MKPWKKLNISKEQWLKNLDRIEEENDRIKPISGYVSRPDLEAEYIYYHGTWIPKRK